MGTCGCADLVVSARCVFRKYERCFEGKVGRGGKHGSSGEKKLQQLSCAKTLHRSLRGEKGLGITFPIDIPLCQLNH